MKADSKNSINIELPPWPKEAENWGWRESDKWLQEKIEEALDLQFPEWREGTFYMVDFQLEGVKTWTYK